jgi:hypothetical protein
MTDCSLIIAQVGSASALFHVNPCLMNNGHCAKDRLDKHVMQFQLLIGASLATQNSSEQKLVG